MLNNYFDARQQKYMATLAKIAEENDINFKKAAKKDIEAVVFDGTRKKKGKLIIERMNKEQVKIFPTLDMADFVSTQLSESGAFVFVMQYRFSLKNGVMC